MSTSFGRWVKFLRFRGSLMVLVLGVLNGLARAQAQLNWSPQSSPSARVNMGMVFDQATRSTLLFGGQDGAEGSFARQGDTWTWGEGGWSLKAPAVSPSPRQGQGMAYDAATRTVVLFGGADSGGTVLNDTWTWDGINWTQQFPSASPPARGSNPPGMAYDPGTRTVVLFGGEPTYSSDLNDTWTWDGIAKIWTQHFPAVSPSPRFAPMAHDGATGGVILFGGGDATGNHFNDTWIWNGRAGTWTQRFPIVSPSARTLAAMCYDEGLREIVVFGGSGPLSLQDTWTWDGTNWTEKNPVVVPHDRYGAGMDYDSVAKAVVMFGGYSSGPALSDTWVLKITP
jgi:hypothetical protein